MIYLEVQGNLGNQLFQYATARQLQELTGQKICLNLYNFNKGRPDLKFMLDSFVLNENVIIERNRKLPLFANSYSFFTKVIKKICPRMYFNYMRRYGVYFWQGGATNMFNVVPRRNNYYLSGWFQNPGNFNSIREIIKAEFQPKAQPVANNAELYSVASKTESVCISIRRGDYITNQKFNKIFYVCNEQYFEKAIEEIKNYVANPTFIFFSDDIKWVKENIDAKEGSYYESGEDAVWEKIRLMSSCKHYILSNSSFSWWTQYLGKRKETIVIAPSRWNNQLTGPDGRYQEDWTLISV